VWAALYAPAASFESWQILGATRSQLEQLDSFLERTAIGWLEVDVNAELDFAISAAPKFLYNGSGDRQG
jgi:hypothetical protein